jgi:hypothetical protein
VRCPGVCPLSEDSPIARYVNWQAMADDEEAEWGEFDFGGETWLYEPA